MEERRSTSKSGIKDNSQNLIMENRKKLSVSGAVDVASFDEETIVLETTLGRLTIRGEGLHINKLSTESGEVVVEGTVNSCVYTVENHNQKSGGLLRRMFQ